MIPTRFVEESHRASPANSEFRIVEAATKCGWENPRSFSRSAPGRRWISSNYYINIVIRNSSVMIFLNDWGGPNNVKELPFGHLLVSNGYLNIHDTFFWVWRIKISGENWSGRTDTKKKNESVKFGSFLGGQKSNKNAEYKLDDHTR